MAANDSEITPHEDCSVSDETFVAAGSTCTCFRIRQHGRLLLKKQLLPTLASDERCRQALEKEFEIGYNLDHPNIPRYLEFHGEYLLMEYVDGVTLATFHEQHPDYFKEKRHARQFADELCSAVAYLHQHQVIHLDLKPDNILLTYIGNHAKLVDLGYCYQDSYPFTTGGTTHYSAPEKEKTPASDIYSIGRIFGELGIADERVTSRCLSSKAADRYQSIDELAAAMQQNHFPWKAAASILFVLLLSIGIWWWVGKMASSELEPSTIAIQEELPEKVVQDESSGVVVQDESSGVVVQDELSGEVVQEESSEKNVNDELSEMTASSNNTPSINLPTAPEPFKTESERQEAMSSNVEFPATTGKEYVAKILREPGDMLMRNQKESLPSFVSVTDSILAELKQFVSNDRMPYQMGSLEAYKAAYESKKASAIECGERNRNVPFWMHVYWNTYNGKPKTSNMFAHYLYLELASIDALFQTHATNYNLSQKQRKEKPLQQ